MPRIATPEPLLAASDRRSRGLACDAGDEDRYKAGHLSRDDPAPQVELGHCEGAGGHRGGKDGLGGPVGIGSLGRLDSSGGEGRLFPRLALPVGRRPRSFRRGRSHAGRRSSSRDGLRRRHAVPPGLFRGLASTENLFRFGGARRGAPLRAGQRPIESIPRRGRGPLRRDRYGEPLARFAGRDGWPEAFVAARVDIPALLESHLRGGCGSGLRTPLPDRGLRHWLEQRCGPRLARRGLHHSTNPRPRQRISRHFHPPDPPSGGTPLLDRGLRSRAQQLAWRDGWLLWFRGRGREDHDEPGTTSCVDFGATTTPAQAYGWTRRIETRSWRVASSLGTGEGRDSGSRSARAPFRCGTPFPRFNQSGLLISNSSDVAVEGCVLYGNDTTQIGEWSPGIDREGFRDVGFTLKDSVIACASDRQRLFQRPAYPEDYATLRSDHNLWWDRGTSGWCIGPSASTSRLGYPGREAISIH